MALMTRKETRTLKPIKYLYSAGIKLSILALSPSTDVIVASDAITPSIRKSPLRPE
jgi:hypothetical protein